MTPEEQAREVLTEARLGSYIHHNPVEGSSIVVRKAEDAAQVALDALAAAGLRVVSEGHAVIDGEVVRLDLNEVVSLRGRLRRADDDEDEPPCPVCGGEPGDTTLHTKSCPTLGTCGQCEPDLDPPWHPDEEWWDGKERYSVAFDRHVRTAHRTPTGGAPDTEGRPEGEGDPS